ncbi:type IV pilus twitching motility protein PilT [Chloroflexota bacterium]
MDIVLLLKEARDRKASDLHLIALTPPLLRIDGSLQPIENGDALNAEEIAEALTQLTSGEQREDFEQTLELDFGLTRPDIGYLRCNAARQRNGISLAIRLLPPYIPTIDELELPPITKELALRPRGLVVVTGPTGSGKTTTLAAMIQYMNEKESRHIVTIEDPIEYVHPTSKGAITQRQLGDDTLSFPNALRHVLRQDPDVILVGEMRDFDTAAAVLAIAETGHLILTTGHAPSAPQAVERIIDLFPYNERHLAQARLASLLNGVLCQTLVPRASGAGRIAAVEVMLANSAVRSLIRDGKIFQLPNVITTHREIGMISLDETLVNLHTRGVITFETMMSFCNNRNEVEEIIKHTTSGNIRSNR